MTKRTPAKRTKVKRATKLSRRGHGERPKQSEIGRDVEEGIRLSRKIMHEYREVLEKLAKC